MQSISNNFQHSEQTSDMPHQAWRWFLILFLILEYIRPPVLPQLKLQFIFIVLVALALLTTKDRPRSGILFAMLLFFAVIVKSLPFSLNYYSVYLIMNSMFGYIAVAFALAWLMSWRQAFKRVIWIWAMILAYCAIYAIFHDGRGPPGGYLGDENDLALACTVVLPLALFGIDYFHGWRKWASAGLVVLFVAAIVSSYSRGGFLGLVAVGLYYLISSQGKVRKVLIMGTIISAFLAFVPQKYMSEIETIQSDADVQAEGDSTAKTRLFLWTAAFNMLKDNPIMGVGAANFPAQVNNYLPSREGWPKHYFERGWGGTDAHSTYFGLMADLGIPGVVIYIYIIFAHIRGLRLIRREMRTRTELSEDVRRDFGYYSAALIGGMIGFLTSGVFVGVLYYAHFWYLCGMGVALLAAFQREVAGPNSENQ